MDFDPSDDQRLLVESITRLLADNYGFAQRKTYLANPVGYSPDMWTKFAELGLLGLPFAEEYLFRGLLYRALDREWGGWRAVLGSAAFFAVYHPALSWLPVAALGAANAMLYKKTGYLAPAIALHLVYNAVVLR